MRAWRRRASCATPDAPLPWLLAITRNEALRYRARDRNERAYLQAVAARVDPVPAAADPAENATDRVWIDTVVRRLSSADQRLLRLRYESDLTTAQIARRLGMPEGTVKIRLHRMRKRLRGELE